jgi:hypothetical protein
MNFPEHEKMEKKSNEIKLLSNFLNYLKINKELRICKKDNVTGEFFSIYEKDESLIADYFYINLNEIEKEKEQMKTIISNEEKDGNE